MEHAKPNNKPYILTFLALLVLTATTFGLSYTELGALEVPIALAIAAAKAVLVALFFMHLIEHNFTNQLVLIVAVLFIGIMVSLTALDFVTRAGPPVVPPLTG